LQLDLGEGINKSVRIGRQAEDADFRALL
jgi:hypothetical protein